MYRNIFIASLAAAFLVAQATPAPAEPTTIHGSKSNSSDRMGGGGTGTQTPAGATTVHGSKSNSSSDRMGGGGGTGTQTPAGATTVSGSKSNQNDKK